jgi:uncharacterized protein YjbI with pentapeptide repeats
MANPEHLAILKQGVEEWNKWRGAHPTILFPDLSEADLHELDLHKARLSQADLRRADLRMANLSESNLRGAELRGVEFGFRTSSGHSPGRWAALRGANLSGADLGYANLQGASLVAVDLSGANLTAAKLVTADLFAADIRRANLKWADLYGANLRESNLSSADLSKAALHEADLCRSNLTGTNLSQAQVRAVNFGDTDLSVASGLETIKHDGPSTIGIDTIYKSRGKIPEVFLRGCGVPDEFIAYIGSMVGRPIEFYSCFISYSSKDQEFADRLYADLQAKGVRCWFAQEDLKIGDRFQERIEESIRVHDKLLLVLSENSVVSPWVEREVQAAFEREDRSKKPVLFPIRVDEAVMEASQAWAADIRRTRHIGEFGNWRDHNSYTKALERLLRDLKAETAAS